MAGDPLAAGRIGKALLDVGQHPGRSLDGQQGVQPQARLADFLGELLGQVEVGGCEPLRSSGRVAVLAVAHVAFHDGLEAGLVQVAAQQAVQGGRKAGDRRRGQHPTRA